MNYSQIYRVLELNLILKNIVSERFTKTIQVVGEISNYKHYPNSGHSYFSIKDEQSQINCVFFKYQRLKSTHNNKLIELKNGIDAVITAGVQVYEKNSTIQLIVYDVELKGRGTLEQQFEQTRLKLEKQGLFNEENKKKLPSLPIKIGIISSLQSDALQDILAILRRRYPIAKVTIYPSSTQGEKAAQEMIRAINLANKHGICQTLILTRGGGSIEDLWSFNDETLALTIHQSKIPIISAIGHQNNYTISDYVSDLRAPTPSAAAEMISKDITQISEKINLFAEKMNRLIYQYLQKKMQQVDELNERIFQKINYLLVLKISNRFESKTLIQLLFNRFNKNIIALAKTKQLIETHSPINKIKNFSQDLKYKKYIFDLSKLNNQIQEYKNKLNVKQSKINQLIVQLVRQKNQIFNNTSNSIKAINPLFKGFALISSNKKIIKNTADLKLNQLINIRFRRGDVDAQITKINK